MNIVEKANLLVDKAGEITLASVSEEGYPRVCVLSKIKSEGMKRMWVATGLNGIKAGHFVKNPKASACIWIGNDSITLVGEVQVRTDRETREAMWLNWFIDHFKEGIDDPNYCVLEFTALESTMWIESEFATVKV